jgi:predicted CXXCH cytochrome family protein
VPRRQEEHNNYKRGEHWRNDVACTDCHSPHLSARLAETLAGVPQGKRDVPSSLLPVGPFSAHSNDLTPRKMLVRNEPQLCLTCHNEMKAQFTQPFHHRVLEGAMNCSDCTTHGGFEMKQARLSTGADASCVKCHADKQGPFVSSTRPPRIEGCAICHTPHGASNPKMLKRNNVNQLCLECHSNVELKVGEIDARHSEFPQPGDCPISELHNVPREDTRIEHASVLLPVRRYARRIEERRNER